MDLFAELTALLHALEDAAGWPQDLVDVQRLQELEDADG